MCLLFQLPLFAEEQPAVTCLQVDDMGNVTVNWTPPNAPTSSFSHYEVFYSISPDLSFTSIATNLTPLALNNYTHNSNLALSNNYYYYVLAWYDDGSGGFYSATSDTLSTIHLDAYPALSSCSNCDSAAYLEWTEPMLPLGTVTEALQYQIWTDYPSGSWQLLTTVGFGVNEYIHYVFNCYPVTMNFRIRLVTPDGCEFISNSEGDQFSDNVFPNSVSGVSIGVDANGYGMVEWQGSSSSDVQGYEIYRCQNGSTISISAVDASFLSFTDVFGENEFGGGAYSYAIAGYDGCGNYDTTSCSYSNVLEVLDYVVCDQDITIRWDGYYSWSNPASYYIVYKGFGLTDDYATTSMAPIDTVAALNYVDVALQYGGYNIYRIEAVDTLTGFRVFSNFHDTYVDDYAPPSYVEIQSASVLNVDSVQITLGISPTALSFRYELQRLEPITQTWEEVVVQDASAVLELVFIDDERATDVFSYCYRVLVFNSCALAVDTSNVACTIILDGQANQERLVNALAWTPYREWHEGVEWYNIYRRLKDTDYELIDEVNGSGSLFYEDDVSELVETDGDFFYRIEAIERSDNSRTPFSSLSNEVNLSMDPIIWIPNAIVIGGYNEICKPTVSFALVEEYYMVVFSSWGDLIFETYNVEEGWDGRMNGKAVEEGVYNYYITVKDGRGRAIDRFGHITVLNYE